MTDATTAMGLGAVGVWTRSDGLPRDPQDTGRPHLGPLETLAPVSEESRAPSPQTDHSR